MTGETLSFLSRIASLAGTSSKVQDREAQRIAADFQAMFPVPLVDPDVRAAGKRALMQKAEDMRALKNSKDNPSSR